MKRVTAILMELGLDTLEIDGYLELLQKGPIAVSPLSKRLGVPRTTAYTMLERLATKGVVKESSRKGVKVYCAEPPDALGHIFSQRVTALDNAHKQFMEILPELRERSRNGTSAPRMTVIEGPEGLQGLLRDMLHYGDIQTASVWPIKKMMDVLTPDFFHFHNQERIKRNIYTRAIWPDAEKVSIKKYPFMGWGDGFKREIRIAPNSMIYALGYWIYANKVAFISSAKESYGFLIQSEELAQTLLAQFELLWSVSVPLSFDPTDTHGFLNSLKP